MEFLLAFLTQWAPLFQFLGFIALILVLAVTWRTDLRLAEIESQINLANVNLENHAALDEAEFARLNKRASNLELKIFGV